MQAEAETTELRDYLTGSEAARLMGTSRTYVNNLVELGSLPEPLRIRLGQRELFLHRRADVVKYRETHPNLGRKRTRN